MPGTTDTEIDWRAYIQQVEQYRSGERDYTLIKGDTGWTSQCTLLSLLRGCLNSLFQVLWSTQQPICSSIMLYTSSPTEERIYSSLNVRLRLCTSAP